MDETIPSEVNESDRIIKQPRWLISVSEIKPGNSAVLGGNKFAFYGIHYIALVTVAISVISSIIVIISIHLTHRSSKRWDFSDRFPLYLAIADGIWGVVNLPLNQVVLVINEIFPDQRTSAILGLNVAMFFGYQQLMGAGLATYTYLKVVRRVSLDLGKYEWKLQVICVTFIAIPTLIFYLLGGLGCSGYWFLADATSLAGVIFQYFMTVMVTFCFLFTVFAYKAIKKVVEKQRQIVMELNALDDCDVYHSTAIKCLTTFVYFSICVNGLMSIIAWSLSVQFSFGVLEPLTFFVGVIFANSNGWANCWTYFHNKKIKERRRLLHLKSRSKIVTSSTNSTGGSTNLV